MGTTAGIGMRTTFFGCMSGERSSFGCMSG
jgi:hypothetical protein